MSKFWLPPELPHLEHLLNPVEVRRIVNSVLPVTRKFVECHLTHIRYRLNQNCTLTWLGRAGESAEWFSILACRDRASLPEYRQASDPHSICRERLGIFHLSEFEALLHIFPNERKLPGLDWLTRTAALTRDLSSSMPHIFEQGTLTPVQYVAERSYTVRLASEAGLTVAYGKFYRRGESARIWKISNELWRARSEARGSMASPVIPSPLAWHAASESVWMGAIVGAPVEWDTGAPIYARIGGALALLHQIRIDIDSPPEVNLNCRLQTSIQLLSRVRPDLARRLDRLAERLVVLDSFRPEERDGLATLHGDLHLKNIVALADGQIGRIGLIDLDNLTLGDPLIDLGSFAAYLHSHELTALNPVEWADRRIGLLCEGYQLESGRHIDLGRLRWTTAAALINERACRMVTRLRPDGPVMIGRLLELAERMLVG